MIILKKDTEQKKLQNMITIISILSLKPLPFWLNIKVNN